MRSGVGALFLLAGGILLAQMTVAALKAGGGLPWLYIDAPAWSRLFFGHFLLTTASPIIYVGLSSYSQGRLLLQGLIDTLIGLLAYIGAFTGTLLLLVSFKISPWWGLWPGFVLVWYGFRLRRGKQFPSFELR